MPSLDDLVNDHAIEELAQLRAVELDLLAAEIRATFLAPPHIPEDDIFSFGPADRILIVRGHSQPEFDPYLPLVVTLVRSHQNVVLPHHSFDLLQDLWSVALEIFRWRPCQVADNLGEADVFQRVQPRVRPEMLGPGLLQQGQ